MKRKIGFALFWVVCGGIASVIWFFISYWSGVPWHYVVFAAFLLFTIFYIVKFIKLIAGRR